MAESLYLPVLSTQIQSEYDTCEEFFHNNELPLLSQLFDKGFHACKYIDVGLSFSSQENVYFSVVLADPLEGCFVN